MENKLIVENRKTATIKGVIKVKTATEMLIELALEGDSISINGNNMHINRLDLVEKIADIDGEINCIKFGKSNKESILKKVFK